jgi:pimeloyl-ACP methyl ester carboxylesterase
MTLKHLLLGAAICAPLTPASAETFVLVHGAFQSAADWQAAADALRAGGDTAVTINLPGRAGDGRALGTVQMADHVATVMEAVKAAAAADPDGKVTLVGHSFGGMVISAVAERDRSQLAGLVYVAAYLPRVGTTPGDSMQDLATSDHHGAWKADSFVPAADYSSASVNPRDRAEIFANDAEPSAAKAIVAAMVDEPLAPLATPVPLTANGFGTVRVAYIVTLRDKAVSTDMQLTMLGRGSVAEALSLDTGHSPLRTAPDALAKAIRRAATPEIE